MFGDGGTDTGSASLEPVDPPVLSCLRARLASFDHAYAVALQVQRQTGRCQFILRTGNALQPVRTGGLPPRPFETLLAIIG